MSLRNVASSVAFCCARAPTKVSRAPTIASATYNSQRHRAAFLPTTLPVEAVIPYLLATRGQEWGGGCPNACRLPYCDFPCFASAHIRPVWTTPSLAATATICATPGGHRRHAFAGEPRRLRPPQSSSRRAKVTSLSKQTNSLIFVREPTCEAFGPLARLCGLLGVDASARPDDSRYRWHSHENRTRANFDARRDSWC